MLAAVELADAEVVGVPGVVVGVVAVVNRSRFAGRLLAAGWLLVEVGKKRLGGAHEGSCCSSTPFVRNERLEKTLGWAAEPKNASFSESIVGVPGRELPGVETVSYTHLTLPTKA